MPTKKQRRHKHNDPSVSNHGKAWFPCDDELLLKLYAEEKGANSIASSLCRSPAGIKARLVRLGIVPNRRAVREEDLK